MSKKKSKPFARRNCHGKADTRPVIWTPEKVTETLVKCLDLLKKDEPEQRLTTELRGGKKQETIVRTGYKFYFIGHLMDHFDLDHDYMDGWRETYKGVPEILLAIKRIKQILHSRAWECGLRGDIKENLTKFHLINNFGAKDVTQTEHSGQVQLQHSHKRMIEDAIRRSKGVK